MKANEIAGSWSSEMNQTSLLKSTWFASRRWLLWITLAALTFLSQAMFSAAHAAAPSITMTNYVQMFEDGTANVSFAVGGDSAAYLITTVPASSNPTLIRTNEIVVVGTGASRTLRLTPRYHQYGDAVITLVATDTINGLKTTNSFDLTVLFIDYAPTFLAPIANKTILEDARPTNINFVVYDYETLPIDLIVTARSLNQNIVANDYANNLFITGTGTNRVLNIAPVANANGAVTIEMVIDDGWNKATNNFVLTMIAVNDPPTFSSPPSYDIVEDAGLITISNFVTSISNGPADEGGQSNWFSVSITNSLAFEIAPAVDATGTLSFKMATNYFGTNRLSINIYDDAGTNNNGKNFSTNSLLLRVQSVNDAPSFSLASAKVKVKEDAGLVTVTGFAYNMLMGPTNETGQKPAFLVNSIITGSSNVTFSIWPTVDALGTLTFKTPTNINGTNLCYVIMNDAGGTDFGGVATSTNTFILEVAGVNDAPRIMPITSKTVMEDSAPVNYTFTVTDLDDNVSNVTVTATIANNSLATLSINGNNVTNRVLTVTPKTNAFGATTISLVAMDSARAKSTNTFFYTISAVNDAPTFVLTKTEFLTNEDAGLVTLANFATNMNVGPTNEASQKVSFTLTVVSNGVGQTDLTFTTPPAISVGGSLSFKTTPFVYGTNVIRVVLDDGGGAANTGVATATNTFTLKIRAVNNAPRITMISLTNWLEDFNNITDTNHIDFLVDDVDSSVSNVTVTVSNSNPGLVFVTNNWLTVSDPTNRYLGFRSITNANGSAVITLIATDADGGRSTNKLSITLAAVNDQPTNRIATGITNIEDAGLVTIANFVTNIYVGPTNEVSQRPTFTLRPYWDAASGSNLTNATNVIFASAPAISATGVLTYRTATNSFGTNLVTVVMNDGGGTNNGGLATFTNTFFLCAVPVNDPPYIAAISNMVYLENFGTTNVALKLSDVDDAVDVNDTISISLSTNTIINASLVAPGSDYVNQSLKIDSQANAYGAVTVSLTVTDSHGSNSITRFTVTVTSKNNQPSFVVASNTVKRVEDASLVTITNFITSFNPGAVNEASQKPTYTVIAVTNQPRNAAFAILPTLTTNNGGTLTFKTATNSFGTNILALIVNDGGGTNIGGLDKNTNNITLEVSPVNDAPYILGLANMTFTEEDREVTTNFIVFDIDNNISQVTMSVTNDYTNMISAYITNVVDQWNHGHGEVPNTNKVLILTLVSNIVGTANIGVIAYDGDLSTTNTIAVTVTPTRNHAPTFTVLSNTVTVLEEAGLVTIPTAVTNMSAGPTNENRQSYSFICSSNATFYAAYPAISLNGTLTFAVAPNVVGSNIITVVMKDTGGTTNGGVDTSTNYIVIYVTPVNDAPNFTVLLPTINILEDNGNIVSNVVGSFNVGPADEVSQTNSITFACVVTNAAFFAVQPTIVTNAAGVMGVLTARVAPDVFGTNTIGVIMNDHGGTSDGGVQTNTTKYITFQVASVNDKPLFNVSIPTVTVAEDSGTYIKASVLTGLSSGPANESGQTYSFACYTTNSIFYAVEPTILVVGTTGSLKFTTAANAIGSDLITVVMTDNGGMADGGVNLTTNFVTLTVTNNNDQPVIAALTNMTIWEDDTNTLTYYVTVSDIDPGFAGAITNVTALASPSNAWVSAVATNVSGTVWALTLTPVQDSNGVATVTVYATDGSNATTTGAFMLTNLPVNDPPYFATSSNTVKSVEDAGVITVTNYLTSLRAGPSTTTNENDQTWQFTATPMITMLTNAVFAISPSIDTNGTLTFKAATNSFGTNLVTVVMQDNGGTDRRGVDSVTNTFWLEIAAANDAPVIATLTNKIILEDSTSNLTYVVSVSDIDAPALPIGVISSVTATVSPAIATVSTITPDAGGLNWTLTFAPVQYANGAATVEVIATDGGGLTATNTFTLTINPVNNAPSFTITGTSGREVQTTEDAGLRTINNFVTTMRAGPVGATDENTQTYAFTVTATTGKTTNASFVVLPSIATNGTLTFRTAANSFGTNMVTVVMQDNGGTGPFGVDSLTKTFNIEVSPGNDTPVIDPIADMAMLEDATTVSQLIVINDVDTPMASVTNRVTAADTTLATIAIVGTGKTRTMNVTPLANANGTTLVEVVAGDGGDVLATNTFTLTILSVNDAPSFGMMGTGTNVFSTNQNAGFATNVTFATNLFLGAVNESTNQTNSMFYTVTQIPSIDSTTNVLFDVPPYITTNGTLIFMATTNSYGTNDFSVILNDGGGTDNGGVATVSNYFQIKIAFAESAPWFGTLTNMTILEDAISGLTYNFAASNYFYALDALATVSPTNIAGVVSVGGTKPNFVLTFAPTNDAFGTVTVTLVASNHIGGGMSATNNFTLTVLPVNDAPFFMMRSNATPALSNLVAVVEDAGPQTILNAASRISVGPTNESYQPYFFTCAVTNPSFYASPPEVDVDGTLTFTAAPNAYGTNWIEVVMHDWDDLDPLNLHMTATSLLIIEVAAVNDAPALGTLTNRAILERASGTVAHDITVSDLDTVLGSVTVYARSLNTNVVDVSATASGGTGTRTLTFTPVANANGVAIIQVWAYDTALYSATNTFTLTISPINNPPTFDLSATNVYGYLTTAEDSGLVTIPNFLTNITAGPASESGQTLAFTVNTQPATNVTNAVFDILPSITVVNGTNGTLTFKTSTNSFGTNLVTIILQDNGRTADGGVDSVTNTFMLGIVPADDAPIIATGSLSNKTVLEDSGAFTYVVTVSDVDTNATPFGVITDLTVNVSPTNAEVTSIASSDSYGTNWTVSFTTRQNSNGVATVTLIATDGGGLLGTNTFQLFTTAVNDQPYFAKSADPLSRNEDAGSITVSNFLTGMRAGPVGKTSETNQSWAFTVTTVTNTANNATFTVMPAISSEGTLTYATAPNSYGTNAVTVVMRDNGGTLNGGVNSYTNTFSLETVSLNDAPVVGSLTNKTMLEDVTSTYVVTVTDIDAPAALFGSIANIKSTVTPAIATIADISGDDRTLTIVPEPNTNGVATVEVVATDGGGLTSTNTFQLTITPVNDIPNFTVLSNTVGVLENLGLQTIPTVVSNMSVGPTLDETNGQTYTLSCLVTNPSFFAVQPTMTANGNLSFKVLTNTFGDSTIQVVMKDSGGTANGGVDSYTNYLQLYVTNVNIAPTFTLIKDTLTSLEDATNVVVTNVVAFMSVGPPSEGAQTYTFTCETNVGAPFFASLPTMSTNGTLTYQTATNVFGTNILRVIMQDSAATAFGGKDTATNYITIIANPVNDAPTLLVVSNLITLAENMPLQTFSNVVTNMFVGASNETDQAYTLTCVSNAAFFAIQPSISTNGTLTFQTKPNVYGTTNIVVIITDDGGTTNGGVNSSTNYITLAVTNINAAPVMSGVTNHIVILEDAKTGTNVAFTVTDVDDFITNVTVTVTVGNVTVAGAGSLATVTTNGTGSTRSLLITLTPNANGSATITNVVSDGTASTTNLIDLTVLPVNDVPAFTVNKGTNVIGEDAGSVTISGVVTAGAVGPSDESTQTVAYVCSSNLTFFAVQPSVDNTSGDLTFQVATNVIGTNIISVTMKDSGGTANGGIDSVTKTVILIVTNINDGPYFVSGATNALSVKEDATPKPTVTIVIADIDTAMSNITVVTSTDTNLLTAVVTGNTATRTMTLTLKTNMYGTASITNILNDGMLTATNTQVVTVTPVNDAPSFGLFSTTYTVDKFGAAATIANLATNIQKGPTNVANESSQVLDFLVTTTSTNLFIVQPAIDPSGNMTFTPSAKAGTAILSIRLHDDGTTTNGGVDTSSAKTFTIVIPNNPFNVLQGDYAGLFYTTNALDNDSSGYVQFSLDTNGAFAGTLSMSGTNTAIAGHFNISASYAAATIAADTSFKIGLTLDTTGAWTETVTGMITNTVGNWIAPVLAYHNPFGVANPTELMGEYLVVIPGDGVGNNSPGGDGIASVIISEYGDVSISGYLADDTYFTQETLLGPGGQCPIYAAAYGVNGSLNGWVTFLPRPSVDCFASGSTVVWIKKTEATGNYYSAGYTNSVSLTGSLYNKYLTDLTGISTGYVLLSGGNLTDPIMNTVTIANDVITVDPTATNGLTLVLDRDSGQICGSFGNPVATNVIYSVIQQNQSTVHGYFLGTNGVGTNVSGLFILQK